MPDWVGGFMPAWWNPGRLGGNPAGSFGCVVCRNDESADHLFIRPMSSPEPLN